MFRLCHELCRNVGWVSIRCGSLSPRCDIAQRLAKPSRDRLTGSGLLTCRLCAVYRGRRSYYERYRVVIEALCFAV